MPETKKDIIDRLQQDILRLQGFAPPSGDEGNRIGLGPVEEAFPNGIFPVGAIHEFLSFDMVAGAACGGFISGLLRALMPDGGACLWIGRQQTVFPPALKAFGIAPDRVIFVNLPLEKDVLWVMEEALKCEGFAAVIAEVREVSIVQSRRLQLAVENSKVTGFLLRNDPRKLSSNTCTARWQITPVPSELEEGLPGVGRPRWQVALLKVRNGNPGCWTLEWSDDHFIDLAAPTENGLQMLKAV
ncbi:ImuA family protein [Mucilaginibacter sp.]|jgi:protein ImuA|uniref:ImuA family protein n=1 Tax=Mucilaginibacter sp. TaxID=1882438 RepID=UPI0035645E58